MILVRGRARDMPPGQAPAGAAAGRESVTGWGDRVTQAVVAVAGLVPLGALAFIVIVMVVSAIPAIVFSGAAFFTGDVFSLGSVYAPPIHHHGLAAPFGAAYGALPLILGTFVTSLIAIGLAIRISVGGVLMLSEWLPRRAQRVLSLLLELLAGIPSVVFGIWGVSTFGPFMAAHVYPPLTKLGSVIPWLRGPVGAGQGLLTASLVLAIMVVPIVASTTRELVRGVPVLAREGALALGMTRHETAKVVTIPYVRNGILAAALLGWGRALGETMAVLFIIGNVLNGYPQNLYLSANTLAATIAGTLDGALTDSTGTDISALAEIGLVLLLISLVTNFAGRVVIRRVSDLALPVGRGV